MNILTMGVSGCGKSTVGQRIASHFNLPFIEGDDFHPPANVAKMAAGEPLNDTDRQPWLEALGEVLAKAENPRKNGAEQENGAVIACSALKQAYRDTLRKSLTDDLLIIWLDGSREVLLSRLQSRKNHFFPAHLLDSQLDTLEPPATAFRIDIDQPIDDILDQAVKALSDS
ncbi:MAG: gluconokinase [Saprospiraceae bacterium]